MGKTTTLAANAALLLGSAFRYQQWRRATSRVQETQNEVLRRILRDNADTSFRHEHDFRGITSVADFQRMIPLRSYGDFEPYIQRIASGEKNVLTREPVIMFEPSSGSTAASKLVPYTRSLKRQFQLGIDPWVFTTYTGLPGLLGGRQYWSITPVGADSSYTSAGIPIGFEEDSQYFGAFKRRMVQTLLAVPAAVRHIQDPETFRFVTLRFLLQCHGLSFISVWNPTFLLLLLESLSTHAPALLQDLADGTLDPPQPIQEGLKADILPRLKRDPNRARSLGRLLDESQYNSQWRDQPGRSVYEAIWPALRLISCWADGAAGEYAARLQKLFPNTLVQPKGLIATEGFVSFPLLKRTGSALALTSHFFEFAEPSPKRGDSTPRLAHQLEEGETYSVVLTTGGGLYRYQLHDLVEVTGFVGQCPLIRFLGKQDAVVDLFGEKLNEHHVRSVVVGQLANRGLKPRFWLVAPEKDLSNTAHYTLFLQCPSPEGLKRTALRGLAKDLDDALSENYHYGYCRRLGQLSPLEVFLIEPDIDAGKTYLETCQDLGQRLGDVKAVSLHPYQRWADKFPGRYLTVIANI